MISLAGGLRDDADSSAYNLNVVLENGVTYYIAYESSSNEKVSINIFIVRIWFSKLSRKQSYFKFIYQDQ